jgi:hypothetical protein
MNKSNSLIIGFSILLGFTILGYFVLLSFGGKSSTGVTSPITGLTGLTGLTGQRYEMITANKNNIIIFDKQSGEYWRKFIPDNEGPTEWVKEPSPVSIAK